MQTALKLPLVVKAGTIGRVELRIPWAKLNSEPTQLILDVQPHVTRKSGLRLASLALWRQLTACRRRPPRCTGPVHHLRTPVRDGVGRRGRGGRNKGEARDNRRA